MADPDKYLAGDSSWLTTPWPGLDPKKDEIEHNPTKLKNLATDLQNMLTRLQGTETGSLSDASMRTTVMALSTVTEDWPAGKFLFDAMEKGNKEFTHVYQEIINKLEAAIVLIQAGAGIYDGANIANGGKENV
ncbi:hypothetical protein FHR32_001256 [Streptosporangium album]|uniref:Uncharacterized protein n=1 Tax=Streptosporangium album TaxID=47479 RepID=A0A7W7RRN6_9ACTN|nr:hypothetical protein [Streptosporangium album]MBB4936951.1 hypothetical protein [Streptosporangium album]